MVSLRLLFPAVLPAQAILSTSGHFPCASVSATARRFGSVFRVLSFLEESRHVAHRCTQPLTRSCMLCCSVQVDKQALDAQAAEKRVREAEEKMATM